MLEKARRERVLGLWRAAGGCVLTAIVMGCTSLRTTPANLDQPPDGVRIYPPRVLLLVDAAENRSTIALLPDYERAYDVKPVTVLARQEFRVDLTDGQLESFALDQDTTAIVNVMRDAVDAAGSAVGKGTSMRTINGAFGLESGIYELRHDGMFCRMEALSE